MPHPAAPAAFSRTIAHHLLALFGPAENVDLVDDEDDLLAPLPDLLQEAALALGERAVRRGDEQHQVGAGDEIPGQLLVAPNDRVGARRVHDVDLAKDLGRMGALQAGTPRAAVRYLGSVPQNVDAVGGRSHAFGQYPLPSRALMKLDFPGVELARNHQKKEAAELFPGLLESAQVFGGHVRPEPLQRSRQPLQQLLLPRPGSPALASTGFLFAPAACRSRCLRARGQLADSDNGAARKALG